MIKWALLLAVLFVCGVNAQQVDSETGNIVYSTVNPAPPGTPVSWSGFVVTGSNGGGFSGGATPGYNPNTGTFLFGYTTRTVNYATPVNYALAAAGSNIRVSGLRYSWEYLNQGDNRGTLTGNINLTSNTGQILQNYNYNMPQTINGWTRMAGTETFNTQYAPSSLGNLNVSFTGKDDRFWAGYYGPQIRDFGVNLLYSVAAPVIPTDFSRWIRLSGENEEFTLTNPGVVRYGANGAYIYQSLQPGTYSCSNGAWGNDPIGGVYKSCSLGSNTAITAPIVPKPVAPTADIATATVTDTSPMVVDNVGINPVATTATTVDPIVSTTVVGSSPAASTATSSAAGPTQSTAARESSNVNNTSLGLSVVARNQQREQAIAAQAVQTATSAAAASAAASQQEAAAVATQAVVNSTSSSSLSAGANLSGVGIKLGSSSISASVSSSLDFSQGPDASARLSNMLTDRTNPLNEYIDPRPPLSTNISTTGPVVNRNAADNEAAGGVDLAKMAVAPVGYNDYLTLALRDAAFYAPREVYRNQRTVDNVRALRQLSSDRLHQDMVEQQYRR